MPIDEIEANSDENLSEGYCVEVCVLPGNKFAVSDPKPLPEDSYDEDEQVESITDALKHVLKVVNDNPVSGGEQEGFASVDQSPSDSASKMY